MRVKTQPSSCRYNNGMKPPRSILVRLGELALFAAATAGVFLATRVVL